MFSRNLYLIWACCLKSSNRAVPGSECIFAMQVAGKGSQDDDLTGQSKLGAICLPHWLTEVHRFV